MKNEDLSIVSLTALHYTLHMVLTFCRFYEPVTFQPNIIPVCVPDSDEDLVGQTAWVTGWGRLYEGDQSASLYRSP